MAHKATAILLFIIIAMQTFSRFVVEADYFLNKGFIAKVLCVNKAKPKMHCNGKCYLSKQLKEQQNQEQQSPSTKKQSLDVLVYNLSPALQLSSISQEATVHQQASGLFQLSSFPHSVFRPPSV